MNLASDDWLAAIFGQPVFKVTLTDQPQAGPLGEDLKGALSNLVTQPGFYYVLVPTDRVDQVTALTAVGFRVVDVNVTFERRPATESLGLVPKEVVVREVLPADHEAVLSMAYSCFVYSRFHLDPHISPDIANLIKKEWVHNYLRGKRGDRLLVAAVAGQPVGFLCVMSARVAGELTNIIDLIGVDRTHQGRGAGKALINFFVAGSAGRFQKLRAGTQIANIPSMRLYEACGFKVRETAYVLHAHVPGSGAQP
ncbi:MAG: GNAT family N-acetyltransferase [Desulfobaccales bacterium]|nr:GNAT family N-acetyltransferase [Desulfobaccales bacterium]